MTNAHASHVPQLLVDKILCCSINVPAMKECQIVPFWSPCELFLPCPWDPLLHTCGYPMLFRGFDWITAPTIFQLWRNAWELAPLVFNVEIMQWVCGTWVSKLCCIFMCLMSFKTLWYLSFLQHESGAWEIHWILNKFADVDDWGWVNWLSSS